MSNVTIPANKLVHVRISFKAREKPIYFLLKTTIFVQFFLKIDSEKLLIFTALTKNDMFIKIEFMQIDTKYFFPALLSWVSAVKFDVFKKYS